MTTVSRPQTRMKRKKEKKPKEKVMLVPAQMRMQKKAAKQLPNPEKLLQLMKKQLLNLAAC